MRFFPGCSIFFLLFGKDRHTLQSSLSLTSLHSHLFCDRITYVVQNTVRTMHRIKITALALFMLSGVSIGQTSVQTGDFAMLFPSVPGSVSEQHTGDAFPSGRTRTAIPAAEMPDLMHFTPRTLPASFDALPIPMGMTDQGSPEADLISFEGSYVKDLVRLNWTVRHNADALGFAVERRSQADERWSTVSYERADTKRNRSGYCYFDRSGVRGVTYYRIRQVAANGKSVPTPAICVMPHLVPNSFVIWQHTVDPFTRFGTVSFGLGSSMAVSMTMIDSFGRSVSTLLHTTKLEAGHHFLPFSTYALPAGVYSLRLETSEGVHFQRIAVI